MDYIHSLLSIKVFMDFSTSVHLGRVLPGFITRTVFPLQMYPKAHSQAQETYKCKGTLVIEIRKLSVSKD